MKIRNFFSSIKKIHDKNDGKYGLLKTALLIIYPLFLIGVCELCLFQSFSQFLEYFIKHINVLFFAILYSSAIYITLLFVSKSAVIATGVNSFVFFLLTCIEYYKFLSTGTHFVITDLVMAGNASDLSHFANIQLNGLLVVGLLALTGYTVLMYFLNYSFRIKYIKSLAFGLVSLALTTSMFTVPALSMEIYDTFKINDELTKDSFSSNDRFRENRFLTFFIQSATDVFKYEVQEPEYYSSLFVSNLVKNAAKDNLPVTSQTKKMPNLLFILSESYGDFRKLVENSKSANENDDTPSYDELGIPEGVYDNFDRLAAEGYKGSVILPTFGGYTSRSEFEMMFGLPVYSINTPSIPHYSLEDRELQPTLVSYLRDCGYTTTYIHPFGSTFYKRDITYNHYGFDRLLFEDKLTVAVERYRSYVSDKSLFEQIMQVMQSTDKPDYVMAMSMQNHMPFTLLDDDGKVLSDEKTEYFKGIKATDEAIGYLIERLSNFDEPTILIFSGDHFPFFTDEDGIYSKLNIDKSNSHVLYKNSYCIWSNYPLDYSQIPQPESDTSLFYVPYIAMQLAGVPTNHFIDTMRDQMKTSPVYSPNYATEFKRNSIIDLLTYDRIIGNNYSEDVK